MSDMNIAKELVLQPDKPARLVLWQVGPVNQIAIGLKRGQVLPRHRTPYPAILVVLKGTVEFRLDSNRHTLNVLDTFLVPVGELHEVEGIQDENLFLVTKSIAKT